MNARKCSYILEGTKLLLNPDADVSELFRDFNQRFFWDKLKYVEVRWSPRMTLCAGLCVYNRRPGYCSVRLSRPLLSRRGKVDLVETLLHEMIHAYLFVTENNRDRDGHGPEFLKHMNRINQEVGLNISVFHTFREEVRHYQQHVWQCDGPCQSRKPYFGKVYRAMNRAPGPTDQWWSEHSENCGGSFTKIAEPEGYKPQKKNAKAKMKEYSKINNKDIRTFFKPLSQITMGSSHDSQIKGEKESVDSLNQNEEFTCIATESPSTSDFNSEKTNAKGDVNDQETIEISSDSSAEAEDNSEGYLDSSDSEDTFFGIIGSIIGMPFQYFKRPGQQDVDPSTIKVRKPNFNAVGKTKRGMLKNLIQVPDQPTLDTFYKKKKVYVNGKECSSNSTSSKNKTWKQTSVQSFFLESK